MENSKKQNDQREINITEFYLQTVYQYQKFGKLNKKILENKMNLIFKNENRQNYKIHNLCRQLFLITK